MSFRTSFACDESPYHLIRVLLAVNKPPLPSYHPVILGDGVDRRQWRMKGDGGPPARGMSRSDKGSAGSGEDGKVTSGQEGLQPVAPLRSQDRLAFLPTAKPFRRYADAPITFQGLRCRADARRRERIHPSRHKLPLSLTSVSQLP